jgi:hypothetical protein
VPRVASAIDSTASSNPRAPATTEDRTAGRCRCRLARGRWRMTAAARAPPRGADSRSPGRPVPVRSSTLWRAGTGQQSFESGLGGSPAGMDGNPPWRPVGSDTRWAPGAALPVLTADAASSPRVEPRQLPRAQFRPKGGVMTRTSQQTSTTPSPVYMGHDAYDGFCPVCGTVAPCYRARRVDAARVVGDVASGTTWSMRTAEGRVPSREAPRGSGGGRLRPPSPTTS